MSCNRGARSVHGWRRAALALGLSGAFLQSLPVQAAPSHAACLQAQKDDLRGQVQCGKAEIRRSEVLLQRAYQQARSALIQDFGAEHPMVSALQDNQAAWEKYRHTLCALRIGRGGLWSALDHNACQLEQIAQRTAWLKSRAF